MDKMKDVQRYLKILRLIKAGRGDQLELKDYKFFSSFTFDVDKEAINKLSKEKEFKNLSEEEISEAMQNSFLQAVQDPNFKENTLLAAKDLEKSELTEKITTAMNVALAAGDIATSAGQISAANKAQSNLRKPQRPIPLTQEPLLKQALSEARGSDMDAARALSPAQLQILDQYLSDLNTAKTASGGQAGIYGSLGQVASTRRGKNAAGLVPLYDQIVRQGNQRYDQLLGQKLEENANIQASQSQFYPYDLNQYNKALESAGQLGATGRSNLRSSVGALGGFLPQVLSDLQTRRKFRDIYNSNLMYGENNAKTMARADFDLYNDYQYDNSPSNLVEQFYGIN